MLDKPKLPGKLELALLFNLCHHKPETEGWKTREQIIETDKQQKQKNKGIPFSSQYNNLHNVFRRSIKRGWVEEGQLEYEDDRKRLCKKTVWRLKKNKKTLWALFNISRAIDSQIKPKTITKDFIQTPYFQDMPLKTRKQWENESSQAIASGIREEKKWLLEQYKYHKKAARECKRTLKEAYGINPDKPKGGKKK